MNPTTIKIVAGCVVLVVVSVIVVGRGYLGNAPAPVMSALIATPAVIHTSDWYLAHRDVLKVDEQRCVGDAASIAPAACQNVSEAVSEIDNSNFQTLLQQDQNSNK
jgi:hypothetical protein